jgi:hypothetical protein
MKRTLKSPVFRKFLLSVTSFGTCLLLVSCSSNEQAVTPAATATSSEQTNSYWNIYEDANLVDAQTYYSASRGAFSSDIDTFGKEEYWALFVRCNQGELSFYVGLRPVSEDNDAITATGIFKGGDSSKLVTSYGLGDANSLLLQVSQKQLSNDSVIVWDGQVTSNFGPNAESHTILYEVLNSGSLAIKGNGEFADVEMKFNLSGGEILPEKLSNAGCSIY